MLNIHSIVRGAINSIHPDQVVLWYRSTGQTEQTDGTVANSYASPVEVMAQVQSLNSQDLQHSGNVDYNAVERRFYLFSSQNQEGQPSGIYRPTTRSGDLLKMLDGTMWLITAVVDDYHLCEWVCVRAVLQIDITEDCLCLSC